MVNLKEQEEIKYLIKSGFDLELIAYELDIPLQQIKEYKKQLEENKLQQGTKNIKVRTAQSIIDEKNVEVDSKLDRMRERYLSLYEREAKPSVKKIKKISEEEKQYIDSITLEIEYTINQMKDSSNNEKRTSIKHIISKLKEIIDYQMTIEQVEKLNFLLHSQEIESLELGQKDQLNIDLHKTYKLLEKRLAEALEIEVLHTDDIEKLKMLSKKITGKILKGSPIIMGSVDSKIKNKIHSIQQKNAVNKIRNDVSPNIQIIIKNLANGTIDIKQAQEIISEEAKKRVNNSPKTKFSMTEAQQAKQILVQIKAILAQKGEQYQIANPEETILQLQELCGGDEDSSIRTVIDNLIKNKKFDVAMDICNKFIKTKGDEEAAFIKVKRERNKIRNAELGDLILRLLASKGTKDEERACIKMIEKGLEKGNIKTSAISLGKSKDGLKSITLADIWVDEKDIEKAK